MVSLGKGFSPVRQFVADVVRFAGPSGAAGAALAASGALLEGAGLVLLVPILDAVMPQGGRPGSFATAANAAFAALGVEGRIAKLGLLLGCFAALILLRAIVLWSRDVALAKLRVGFVEAQRTRLVARLAAAPWPQLSKMPHTRINHLLSSDVILAGSCVHFLLQCLVALFLVLVEGAVVFLFSPALATLVLALMLAMMLVAGPQMRRSRAIGEAVVEGNTLLASSGAKFFGGLKLALGQNAQDRFVADFNAAFSQMMRQQVTLAREQSLAQLVFGVLSSLVAAAAIFVAVAVLDIEPAMLLVFVLVLARMSVPIAQLQQGVQQLANFLPAYEKLKALEAELQMPSVPVPRAAPPPALERPAALSFRKVSYRHGAGSGVFDLDLDIPPGTFLGVTGTSGAGKSTFADLLIGLIAPDQGTILLNSAPMTAELRQAWRSSAAYVPQETFLFRDSVRQNLLWTGARAAPDEEIWAALGIAGAHGLVARMEFGLDTVLDERAMTLSGGERQRLAIARALLRKPPLLLLDEATSAIDIAGEARLLESLARLPWSPSIVLIAHRPSSLSPCDRIIEFRDGRIAGDSVPDSPALSARIVHAG